MGSSVSKVNDRLLTTIATSSSIHTTASRMLWRPEHVVRSCTFSEKCSHVMKFIVSAIDMASHLTLPTALVSLIMDYVDHWQPSTLVWYNVGRYGFHNLVHAELLLYSLDEGFWYQAAPMPKHFQSVVSGVIDKNTLLVVNGTYDDGSSSSIYSMVYNVWSDGPPLIQHRRLSTLAVHNHTAYLFGGVCTSGAGVRTISNCEYFRHPNPPTVECRRRGGERSTIHRRIDHDPPIVSRTSILSSGEWKYMAPLIRASHSCSSTVVGNDIYVTGGVSNIYTSMNHVQIFNVVTQLWTMGPSFHLPRYNHASCYVQDVGVIVAGGFALDATCTMEILPDYDSATLSPLSSSSLSSLSSSSSMSLSSSSMSLSSSSSSSSSSSISSASMFPSSLSVSSVAISPVPSSSCTSPLIERRVWRHMKWTLPEALTRHTLTVIDHGIFLKSEYGTKAWWRPCPTRWDDDSGGWKLLPTHPVLHFGDITTNKSVI